MSAPVKQIICDHVDSDRDQVAHPDEYLVDVNWATGFEYGGAW